MALLEDAFKGGNLLTGLGVAVGAVVLGPIVLPLVRPLAKGAIKAGIVAYDQGREILADLNERTGDMVAEVRAEMDDEARQNGDKAKPKIAGGARRAARGEAKPAEGGGGQPAPA